MSLFTVTVVVALDPDLLAVLKQIIALQRDREEAVALAADLKASTGALESAIPS